MIDLRGARVRAQTAIFGLAYELDAGAGWSRSIAAAIRKLGLDRDGLPRTHGHPYTPTREIQADSRGLMNI